MIKNDLIIEIFKENESLDVREGEKNGKPWKQISQIGYAHLGGKFPLECKVKIQDGQPAYTAGKYRLSVNSFTVGRYGDIELGREMILLPLD